mgnify:CR=1 FL=1
MTHQHPFKRPESVLVVVYTTDLEFLLLNRIKPADHWQSVTGSLEWDELPEQAAQRELKEETGIKDTPIYSGRQNTFPILPAWRDRFAPKVTENLEHVFYLQLPDKTEITLNAAEHSDCFWLPQTQAAEKVFSWTNRDAILAC